MLALDTSELALLAFWAAGIAGAVYATAGSATPVARRVVVVLVAVLVPVLGSVLGVGLAVTRLLRGRPADGGAASG